MFGFSKGKIQIQLDQYQFVPGDTIKGKLVLQMKKPLEGKKLTVGLIGTEEVRQGGGLMIGSTSTSRNRSSRSYHEIFNFEKPVDKEKVYSGTMEYPFEIKIPKNVSHPGAMNQGALGGVMRVASMLGGATSTVKWRVHAQLHVKGLDLRKNVNVTIG